MDIRHRHPAAKKFKEVIAG